MQFKLPCWQRHLTVREEGEESERPLPASDTFSITHALCVSLATSNVLVTCETTCKTGLRDNNCRVRNFCVQSQKQSQPASHIKRSRFWKPVSFGHKFGGRLHERTRRRPAEACRFPIVFLSP